MAVNISLLEACYNCDVDSPIISVAKFDDYEMRIYCATSWVATTCIASSDRCEDWNLELSSALLHDYLNGYNKTGQTFPESVPEVVKLVTLDNGQFEITRMFYIADCNPPPAKDPHVFIYKRPAKEVFVRSFQWILPPPNAIYRDHLDTMKEAIGNRRLYSDAEYFRVSFYRSKDAGHTFEVWLDRVLLPASS